MEVSSSAFIHSNGHAGYPVQQGLSSNAHHDNNNSSSSSSKRALLGEPETGSILDPFHIEDLLDFSNEDIAGPIGDEGMQQQQQQQPSSNNNSSVTASGETQGGATSILRSSDIEHANEFSIDCDDMPELEWLSSLVEDDSFCMGEAPKNVFIGGCCSPMSSSVNNKRHLLLEESSSMCNKDRFQVGSPISVLESNSATSGSRMVNVVNKDLAVVPGRPRSKRQRTGVNTWTNSSCVLNNNNSNNSNNTMFMSFSSPATSSVSDYDTTYNIVSDEQHDSGLSLDNSSEQDVVDSGPSPPPVAAAAAAFENKKQFFSGNAFPARAAAAAAAVKGKPPLLKGGGGSQEVQPRRCTHCLSQKTPQWRAGPEGPKTLCNACGVRFKSGRLFPEYRPALSPTFHSEVHSNSHRKVLEMRRQKEVAKPLPTAQEQQQQGEVLDGGLIYK